MEPVAKRKRSANFSYEDQNKLIDLVLLAQDIIENKKTDNVTSNLKEMAWKSIQKEFNASTQIPRDWRQLKTAYENMKHRLKRELVAEGSQATKHVSPAELKLMTLILEKDNIILKSSSSDTSCNNDSTSELFASNGQHAVNAKSTVFSSRRPAIEGTQNVLLVKPDVMGEESSTSVEDTEISASDNAMYELSSSSVRTAPTGNNVTRRPRTASPRVTSPNIRPPSSWLHGFPSSSSSTAVSEAEQDYWQEVLEMKRTEHEMKMNILAFKEKLYSKQLAQYERKQANETCFFKIWSDDRLQRCCITAVCDLDTVLDLACKKLDIDNPQEVKLVLEKDGTRIDSSEALSHLSSEIFLVLRRHQQWSPSS